MNIECDKIIENLDDSEDEFIGYFQKSLKL